MNWVEYFLSTTVLRVCSMFFSLFPLRADKVVFASARSQKLRGNMRFIHAEMTQRWPEREYVLLLRRYSYGLLGKLSYMASLIRAQYHLATAGLFIVDNAYLPVHVRPHRKGTTVIQVWHAAGALKKFGVDIPAENRPIESRFIHKYYDWVIVGSADAVGPYASALRTDESRVIPLGIARTDFFFDEEAQAEFRKRFYRDHPELLGKRIALYAPTFRGYGKHKHLVDALDAKALRERLPEDAALVYKMHPVLSQDQTELQGFDAVLDSELGLNGVMTLADVLITDYSASIFEWALLRKPLILFAPDVEAYKKDPGFYLDYPADLPGAFAQTTEEVAALLDEYEYDAGEYRDFIARYMRLADGNSSRRFVEFIEGLETEHD